MVEVLIRKQEIAELAMKILSGLATDADLEAAPLEEVKAIKCDTGAPRRKVFVDDVTKVAAPSGRVRRYVASQESRDRMGDVIDQSKWDHRPFKKNAVALWAHMDRQLPLGVVVDTEIGEKGGIPTMWQSIDYVEERLNPFAEAVLGLVDAGVLKAVSVGFLPNKQPVWPQSMEEREAMDLGPYGVKYVGQEQLELSNCTVPAHPAALASKTIRRALISLAEEGKISKDAAGLMLEEIERKRKKRSPWWNLNFDMGGADDGTAPSVDGEETAAVATEEPPTEKKPTETAVDGASPPIGDRPAANAAGDGNPVPSTAGTTGDGKAHVTSIHFISALPPGDYRWDGKSLARIEAPAAVAGGVELLSGPSETETKILELLEEIRGQVDDLVTAKLAHADEIADLRSVLRSSSRSADATKFFNDVLNTVAKELDSKPRGGA